MKDTLPSTDLRAVSPSTLCMALMCAAVCSSGTLVLAQALQWSVQNGGNGHWYEFVHVPPGLTWVEARDACVARGGHLATITNVAESDFVFSLIENNSAAWATYQFSSVTVTFGPWLGGYQPPGLRPSIGWRWVTGESFAFTNWTAGEPNELRPGEDYLAYGVHGSLPAATWIDHWGGFSDANALFPGQVQVRGYILELEPPCPADFDDSGVLEVQDVLDYLNAWFTNSWRADFNSGGAVSVVDIFDYLNAWFTGCPLASPTERHWFARPRDLNKQPKQWGCSSAQACII